MEGALLGPYRIVAELGSGGMGTVWLARTERATGDLSAGADVALKVVHTHLLGRGAFFKRFLREARLGRRVRHENVVTTYDMDASEFEGRAVLFLAMEYVKGRTLRRLLEDLGSVPEALLREVARQVAAGLAAIHAAGIVHRDLKPENVLLTDEHQVRIMDLGVARLLEETGSLTEDGQFAGSLLYAAPEQFGGAEVGPAADLYALGGILHELATGSNPFRRDDVGAIIRAHLEEDPPRVQDLDADVSPFLAEVIAALLARKPQDRPASAAFLHDLLVAGEGSTWWSAREALRALAAPHRPRVPVRRETILHGRLAELGLLEEAWHRARAGQGATVLLEGEAGIGKTRLVDAFLDRLAGEDAHVLYGSYPPSGGFGGLSDAIQEHFGAAHVEASLREYLVQAPALAPAFAALVRHDAPPPGAEPLVGDALHAVTVYLMRGLAAQKPLVWVVDDLHFAGPDSRRVVLSMARAVEGHPILLVVTTRPGLPDEEMAHFGRLETLRRIPVGRLSPRQVMELLADAFHSEALAERLGGKIAYKSDGVPFFVLEMIRGLRDGNLLPEGSDGAAVTTRVLDEIEVPSAVRDLVEGRMGHLDAQDRAILDVGAVQGFEFDADLTARVLERKPIPVLQTLAEVQRRSGLVRGSGRLHRFDHHQVQEVLYQELPEALRAEYHAALADALVAREAVRPERPDEVAGELAVAIASHHLRGSRPHAALPLLDRALAHLESSYRNEALVDLVTRAVGIPGLLDDERRIRLLLHGADRLGYLGEREVERTVLARALDLAEALGSPELLAAVKRSEGWRQIRLSQYREAERILAEVQELGRGAGKPALVAAATRSRGIVAYMRARYDEARGHAEQAIRLAREAGDRGMESLAVGTLGVVLRALGRVDESRAHHERHLAMARELGDARGAMNALGNLANLFNYQGRLDEAWATYEEALGIARDIGDRIGEAALSGSMGGVLWMRGELGEARARYESTLRLDREVGNVEGEARMVLNLAQMWRHLGDLPEAIRQDEHALTMARESGARLLEGHALLGLGRAEHERGRLDAARARLEEAAGLMREIGQSASVADALGSLGLVLADAGRIDEARACFQEAVDGARASASMAGEATTLARWAARAGGDLARAREAFEASRATLSVFAVLEIETLLGVAGDDTARLRTAWDLLDTLLQQAPPGHRASMLENVALHRTLRQEAKARGFGAGASA